MKRRKTPRPTLLQSLWYRRWNTEEDEEECVTKPSGRDFQREDVWGDGNDNNPRRFDVGLEGG